MINFYVEKIPGDHFDNFFASNIVEIPAYALGGVLIYYLGVRVSLYCGASISLIGGTLLIIFGDTKDVDNMALSKEVYTILVLLSKGGILILINCVYISTATFFPPIFSGAAFGVCNTFAKSCAIAGPFIAEEAHPIPMAVFTALTALAFPVTFFMKIKKTNDSFREK